MAGSWEPSKGLLLKTLGVVRASQWSNSENQKAFQENLGKLNNSPQLSPNFQRHLVFVLTKLTNIDEKSRVQSGRILDGNIGTHFHRFPAVLVESLKRECLSALDDPSPVIRETAFSLIKTISFKIGKLANWPDMVPRVCQMLESTEHSDRESALDALHFICQEYSSEIMMIDLLHKQLISKLLQFLNHTIPQIRFRALDCIIQVIGSQNRAVMIYMEEFLLGLVRIIKNDSETKAVCEKVCHSLGYILLQCRHVEPNLLVPHMANIVKYVLDVSSIIFTREICEFWVQLAANRSLCKEFLKQEHLIRLVPILLKSLQYSDSEIVVLMEDDPEEESDIIYLLKMEKDLNLTRECNGRALRGLSKVFKEDLLRVLEPFLEEMLLHPDGKIKDAAMATFGFIAEGYETEIETCVSTNLVPLYNTNFQPEKQEVLPRKTSLDQQFTAILKVLMKGIMDENKLVQLSACSALKAVLRNVSSDNIVPYLSSVLNMLISALAKYKRKNRIVLYSTIASLADAVGSHLNKENIQLLLTPLMDTWKALKDDDKDLLSLMKCLASVAKAVQLGFLHYYIMVFNRCISIMQHNRLNELEPNRPGAQGKDFMICSTELISGLVQGLPTHIHRQVGTSELMKLLRQNVKDSRHEVRQASFALLGHLTNATFGLVDTQLRYFLLVLSQNLDQYLEFTLVCDEAVQTLGMIVVKLGERMKEYLPLFLDRLITIINDHRASNVDYLLRNTAVTLGRLGASCPERVAPRLQHFSQQWCASIQSMVDEELKQSAFHDMCTLITANPGGIVQDFVPFCGVIGSFAMKPQHELKKKIVDTLRAIKLYVGDEEPWKLLIVQIPPMILHEYCG